MNRKTAKANRWKNPAYIRNEGGAAVAEALCRGHRLRRRVQEGLALGTFVIEQPNPATLAALSLAGFDFVVLDMEHSAIGITALETLIAAGLAADLVVLVRPMGEDPGLIGKVLDMGAHGIMAPHVDTPERAREVVQAARFSPIGKRGFSPLTRFDALEQPLQALEESTYVIVQIEGKEALERAREIAAVPGVDTVFVGPYDLSLSLGVAPGSPEVSAAAERLARSVPDGISLGIYVDDPADSATWAARRFTLQCVSFDGRMLADGARHIAGRARGDQTA